MRNPSRRTAVAAGLTCLLGTAGCFEQSSGANVTFDALAADAPVTVDWTHEEVAAYHSDKNRAVQFQPLRVATSVVFATGERVVALDADAGSVQWRRTVDGFVSSRPVRLEESVIVGGDEVTALNRRGEVTWSIELERESGGIGAIGDTLFVGYSPPSPQDSVRSPGLARVDTADRAVTERYENVSAVVAQPATDDELAVVVDGNSITGTRVDPPHSVIAYGTDGPHWRHELEHDHSRITPALTSSRVFAASHASGYDGGTIVALERDTGDVVWETERTVGPSSSTALSPSDEFVTFLDGENELVALDRDDGSVAWTADLSFHGVHDEQFGSHRTIQAPVVDENRGYCVVLGALYAIDLETGAIEWAYADENTPFSGRPLVEDGTLFVPSAHSMFRLEI